MKTGKWAFEGFQLDPTNASLWRGQDRVALAPKPFEVLCYLVARAGDLVTKDELLDAVWSGLNVTESSLSVSINALRATLGDDPRAPRYIETVTRRGYRFIAPVKAASECERPPERRIPEPAFLASSRPRWCVGRAAALATMDHFLDRVISGQRQVVFVTGEAGIGKTTFVELLAARMYGRGIDILSGSCVEQFGAGEAFLPLIEALEDGCSGPNGHLLLQALRHHAPTWLAQMPSLLDVRDSAALRSEVFGATRERMLREFCEVVEALCADRPWAIVLEDLHWSDLATLDVLTRLARRDRSACLLVLATYRPADVIIEGHPVRKVHQDLQIHGRCTEVALGKLSLADVEDYLDLRFGEDHLVAPLAASVFGRTRGQPLFVVSLVDYFVAQGEIVLVEGRWRLVQGSNVRLSEGMPSDLRTMLAFQIDRLNTADQRLLEIASAAGAEFSAALVAPAVKLDATEAEQICEALVRSGRILNATGVEEWPDGTVSGRYALQHALYQEVLYQRLAPAQRVSTHRRLGEVLEIAYGARASEVAPILALHFEAGREIAKAIRYLGLAAENSAQRFASREAAIYLTRALDLEERLPSESRQGLRTRLLQQRGWVRRSSGDFLGSLEDLRAMIDHAEASGDRRSEVYGLLDYSRFCLYVDRRNCLSDAERALQKCVDLEDHVSTALLEANAANLRLVLGSWRDEDVAVCRRAVQVLRETQDPRIALRRCSIEMVLEYLSSNYRECCVHADHGRELARLIGDQYFTVLYTLQGAFGLLHQGEFGRLLDYVRPELETADSNANRQAAALCRLAIGWLHAEALDFEGALELCGDALDTVVEANPFNFAIGRNLLAKAFLGLRDYPAAGVQFDAIVHRLEANATDVDASINFHFHHNYCRYWLEIGDLTNAREWAMRLWEISAPAPERTYLALAQRLLGQIALAEGDLEAARSRLAHAVSIVEQAELPLAAWRVYATAADLHESVGEFELAGDLRARSRAVVTRMAFTLDEASPLRETLLTRYPTEGRR